MPLPVARLTHALPLTLAVAVFATALLAWAGATRAAPVPILNAGFEAPYNAGNLPPAFMGDVPPGTFPTGAPPADWIAYFETGSATAAEFLGVLNPGTSADYAGTGLMPCFPGGASEGDNMALLYTGGAIGGQEYGIRQVLTETLQPETVYTLTVDVGNIQSCTGLIPPYDSFFDLQGFPNYRVQLFAGGVLLEEDAGLLLPGEGLIETTTVVYTTGSGPIAPGQNLEIRLINRNIPDVPGVSGLEVDFDAVSLDASPAVAVPLGSAVGWGVAAGMGALGARSRRRGRGRAEISAQPRRSNR